MLRTTIISLLLIFSQFLPGQELNPATFDYLTSAPSSCISGEEMRLDSILETAYEMDEFTFDTITNDMARRVFYYDDSQPLLPASSEYFLRGNSPERQLNEYDDEGNEVFNTFQRFDETTQNWVTEQTTENIYLDELLQEQKAFRYTNGFIVDGRKITYEYDNADNLIIRRTFGYDSDEDTFAVTAVTVYVYDGDGNLVTEETASNDSPTAVTQSRVDYEYEFGERSVKTTLVYDNNSQTFSPWSRNRYITNGSGNITEYRFERFIGGAFVNVNSTIVSYNECDQVLSTKTSFWDSDLQDWAIRFGSEYFYSDPMEVSSVADLQLTVAVFPNPTISVINFNIEVPSQDNLLVIYNASGQRVLVQNLGQQAAIDVSDWEKGSYYYRIKAATQAYSGKFTKL